MIGRRKFIQISSVAAAGLTVSDLKTVAGIWNGRVLYRNTTGPSLGELKGSFVQAPDDARAACYWWWFNGLLNKEGITRDLEEFKKQGIGNVLIINTKGGLGGVDMPKGHKMLSPEWRELNRHAFREAARLGIEVGVNLSSGWCMGGPWITPEYAGRWYLQSKLTLNGPQKFSGTLPLPGGRDGYDNVFNPPGFKAYIDLPLSELDYRDTVIVAVPDNEGEASRFTGERGGDVFLSKVNRRDFSSHAKARVVMGPTLEHLENKPGDRPVPVQQVIDLTSKVSVDGRLEWDVPPGKWTIVRTGHRMTGSKLLIAQPEVDGLSVDWFAEKGVDLQFENLGKVFLEDAQTVKGHTLKYFHDDSFEDGFPNWTARIIEHFKNYQGYDPTPYTPVLAGYIVGSAEISDRFLHDYRKTVADCMADFHYKHFADLCHKNGLLVQNESAGPSRSGSMCMDGMKNLGRSDYPMGEFWLGKRHDEEGGLSDKLVYGETRLENGQNKVTKMAASAAHTYGRETVSAEAFTSHRHWKDSPGMLKQALDRAFCEGVNRIFIHTSTATRPEDGKPGYEYGAGTHFNPNVTWWDRSGAFLSYVARCQHLLRQGKFVADVLYYNGDWAPNLVWPKHIDPALGKGYDYDVCNEEVLLTRLSVRNNRLVLPDGMSYRVLVLPEDFRMPVAVAEKIKALVKGGATVLGSRPVSDPGLMNYPKCDEEIRRIATEVWDKADGVSVKLHQYGKGRVFAGEPVRRVLMNDGIKPDFEYAGEDSYLDFIHRTTDAAEVYFVANLKNKPAKAVCTFRVKGRIPQIWDPVTGGFMSVPSFTEVENRITVPLEFDVFQSLFVVFPKTDNEVSAKTTRYYGPSDLSVSQGLKGAWDVKFDTAWGGPASVVFDELSDWSKHPDKRIKYYSGKAIYVKKFSLNGSVPNNPVFLDLGIVKNIAGVKLNGKDLGTVWTSPWRVDISSALQKKDNVLEIEVINLWPNRLIGDAALPVSERLTHTNIPFKEDDPLLPSGLLGPVNIVVASGINSVNAY